MQLFSLQAQLLNNPKARTENGPRFPCLLWAESMGPCPRFSRISLPNHWPGVWNRCRNHCWLFIDLKRRALLVVAWFSALWRRSVVLYRLVKRGTAGTKVGSAGDLCSVLSLSFSWQYFDSDKWSTLWSICICVHEWCLVFHHFFFISYETLLYCFILYPQSDLHVFFRPQMVLLCYSPVSHLVHVFLFSHNFRFIYFQCSSHMYNCFVRVCVWEITLFTSCRVCTGHDREIHLHMWSHCSRGKTYDHVKCISFCCNTFFSDSAVQIKSSFI